MSTLGDALAGGRIVEAHRPWTRSLVGADIWSSLAAELAAGRLSLFGLWGDRAVVHMALLDEEAHEIAVASHATPDGSFPSLALSHPPAMRPERAIGDLFGIEAVELPDPRPWLDHGRWGVQHPLGQVHEAADTGTRYAFLPSEGEGLHQVAVGPVHAGIIEPGHFRFTANGETVVRLEERFGYAHKGIEGLMAGASIERAAQLAGRTCGDSTVAYALAFARAVESALGVAVPERAHWLRALMAELERLANHLGDIGAVCNDGSFALMHAHCAVLRERVLRAAALCFGHRLMMDGVVPGGVAADLDPEGEGRIRALVETVRQAFPPLVELYDNTTSLQDRTVGTGFARPSLVRQYACGGYVGRASGRSFDARRDLAYPPYDRLSFEVPVLDAGDVNARVWIRIREVEQSLALVGQLLDGMKSGAVRVPVAGSGHAAEGLAVVEGFRGDVLASIRVDGEGRVARCHLRDPSWFQWPVLEAAIEGNIVADFPICNKSFNCAYSGHDL